MPEKREKIYGDLFSDLSLIFKNKKVDLVFLKEVPLHFKFRIDKFIFYIKKFLNR